MSRLYDLVRNLQQLSEGGFVTSPGSHFEKRTRHAARNPTVEHFWVTVMWAPSFPLKSSLHNHAIWPEGPDAVEAVRAHFPQVLEANLVVLRVREQVVDHVSGSSHLGRAALKGKMGPDVFYMPSTKKKLKC